MTNTWIPKVSTEILNRNLENAFKRASGTIGFNLRQSRASFNNLKDSISSMLEATDEPMFMRAMRGTKELSSTNFKTRLTNKEIVAEILMEFYEEANATFQATKATLYAEARAFLKENNVSEAEALPLLSSANDSFNPVPKERMAGAANAFAKERMTPLTKSCIAGLGALVTLIAVIRAPHIAAIGAVIVGGMTYYQSYDKHLKVAHGILNDLPVAVYNVLDASLKTNIERYEEIVNNYPHK